MISLLIKLEVFKYIIIYFWIDLLGKSGPLFDFSATDDVRLQNNATLENQSSHAGKVVERSWYEKNKHIFPANRWEVYDPHKVYGDYTVKDTNKKSS